MAFRNLEYPNLSRRSMLRGTLMLGASAAAASIPGSGLLARERTSWPNVTAMIESYVERGKVPNIVATLGKGLGERSTVARGKIGFGDKPVAGPDSLYRIYSQTKPITGMATMICIDEGLLGLDQELGDILPAFAEMQVLRTPRSELDDTVPAERPITIRHLLTHTAGLGYALAGQTPLDRAFGERGVSSGQLSRLPIPGVPNYDSAKGLAEWADRLAALPLAIQPGTRWKYSASIDLLGYIIEVVSGQPIDEFLHERFFDPLGMQSTYFQVPESEAHRLTDNFGILGGIPIPLDPGRSSIFLDKPPVFWAGSGLVSSPHDYDRFQQMLLGFGQFDGKRVMSERAVRVGISDLLPDPSVMVGTSMAGDTFGAGASTTNGTFAWGGIAGTAGSVDFKRNLRGGLYTQYMPTETYPIREEFLAAIERDLQSAADA